MFGLQYLIKGNRRGIADVVFHVALFCAKLVAHYRTETGILQQQSVRGYYLDLVQAKMGQPSSEYSVANRVAAMQTAFESLGVDADKLNAQSTAVNSVISVTSSHREDIS